VAMKSRRLHMRTSSLTNFRDVKGLAARTEEDKRRKGTLCLRDIHIRTFPKLLASVGIESEVIKEGVGVDNSMIEYRAFEFADSNNMFSQTTALP